MHMEEDRTCVVCNQKFDSTKGVDAHMLYIHPKSGNFEKESHEVPEVSCEGSDTAFDGNDIGSPRKKARMNEVTESAVERLSERMCDSISFAVSGE